MKPRLALLLLSIAWLAPGPATASPPPRPSPPAVGVGAPAARSAAIIVAMGGVLNALRAGDAAAAQLGLGLRWPRADLLFSLGLPALSLFGQLRANLRPGAWTPYLTVGFVVAYNNGSERAPTLSLAGGVGLRVRLRGWLHLYGEALVNQVVIDSLPPGSGIEARTLSLPVLAGVSLEL